jgi:hypothetical protein
MNLRQRQYDEILDEDNRARTKVMDLLYKKINNMKKDNEPKTDDKQIGDKLFDFYIDKLNDENTLDIEAFEKYIVGRDDGYNTVEFQNYNKLMTIYNASNWSNSERANMRNKLMSLIPPISALVLAFEEEIKRSRNHSDFSMYELFSDYSKYKVMLDNIKNGKLKPITLDDVSVEFNKEINNLDYYKKLAVLKGLVSRRGSFSLMNRGDNTQLKNEIDRIEQELGRKLTKDEVVMVAIKTGGYSNFVPYFSDLEDLEEVQVGDRKIFLNESEALPAGDSRSSRSSRSSESSERSLKLRGRTLEEILKWLPKVDIEDAINGNENDDEEEEQEEEEDEEEPEDQFTSFIDDDDEQTPPPPPPAPSQQQQALFPPNWDQYVDFGAGKPKKIYNRVKKNKNPYKYNDDDNNIFKIYDFE